jgi:hypothetical protein
MAVAAVVSVFTASVQAATITYSLVNNAAYQNGLTLTGSITTDGTIGALAGGNITAWSWTLTDGSSNVVGTLSGGALDDYNVNNVSATATQILLPSAGPEFLFSLSDSNRNKALDWVGNQGISMFGLPPSTTYRVYENASPMPGWNVRNASLTSTSSGQWIVAEAIPEPTSALMSALGATMLLRRRRK